MKELQLTKSQTSLLWYAINEDCNRVENGRLAPRVPIHGAMNGRAFNRLIDALAARFPEGEPPNKDLGNGRGQWSFQFVEDEDASTVLGATEFQLAKAFWEAFPRNAMVGSKYMRELIEALDTAFESAKDYQPKPIKKKG